MGPPARHQVILPSYRRSWIQSALAGMTNQLFVSRYQLPLPAASEMEAFLRRALGELGELGVDDGEAGV